MRRALRILSAALAICTIAAPAWAAKPMLLDEGALASRLKSAAPCCVIDARGQIARAVTPLPDTLAYKKGMKINPTSVVIVIADSDAQALEVGEALAATSGATDVVAVKGGAATWQALAGGASGAPAMTFVIPKNTCEQAEPLQTLPFKRP